MPNGIKRLKKLKKRTTLSLVGRLLVQFNFLQKKKLEFLINTLKKKKKKIFYPFFFTLFILLRTTFCSIIVGIYDLFYSCTLCKN